VSAFVGNYSGEWNRISPNWATQNGTIAMTVATNGVVNGTSTNSVRGNGIVDSSGSFVSTGGRFQLVLTYNASGSPVPISDVYVGALRPDSTGRLRGTLHENLGDFNAVVSIDLQKL